MNKIKEKLEHLMLENYTVENLVGVDKEEFKQSIESRIGVIDAESENYEDYELDVQRDLTIKYHWGHDHDFGSFKMIGRMETRHIDLLSNFCELFNLDLSIFENKDVFDIGSWTGGTALILSLLSKNVYSIEEVNKYAETTQYLIDSFDIKNLKIENRSLYGCNSDDLYEKFDIIYFPGVIYHLSDPLLGLRILYNACKIGGSIFIETEGLNSEEPYCVYEGSQIYYSGDKEDRDRGGWNWFLPSPEALKRMLYAAGFDNIEIKFAENGRLFAYAKKLKHVGITKAGLSVQNIR